jgi:uncharacterized membrane protein
VTAQSVLDAFVIGLRWVHVVAILGWVGASLYFMWLDSKMRLPDPARPNVLGEAWMGHGGGFYIVEKRSIAAGQVPSPVYWFRVEAGVTWVTGFLLLVFLYYRTGGLDLVDPQTSPLSPGAAVAFAIGLFVVAWVAYDQLWISRLGNNVPLATTISLVLLLVIVYALCKLFTGRAAFIHVGSIMGTNMVASVWTRIIPSQVEAVAATRAGRERNPLLGPRARRRAIHNTYLTLPVIFTMIAMHAPMAYSHPLNWLVLALVIVVGMAARHLMILFDRREKRAAVWAGTAGPIAASLVALGFLANPIGEAVAPAEQPVPFTVVRGIMDLRCASCHSRAPTDTRFPGANAIRFETPEEIAARSEAIKSTTVTSRAMPPDNMTRMTEEERALIGRWLAAGARAR